MTDRSGRKYRAGLCFAVAGSGATALVYQIVWQRMLVRLTGAALPAVTLIVCIFMLGLGIGSLIGGRLAGRLVRPMRVCAVLETIVAAMAAFIVPALTSQRFAEPVLSRVVSPAICALSGRMDLLASMCTSQGVIASATMLAAGTASILLPPTIIIGSIFPICAQILENLEGTEYGADESCKTPALYMWNLIGAVAGCLSAAFLLLPALGQLCTVRAAAAFEFFAVAGIFIWLDGNRATTIGAEPAIPAARQPEPNGNGHVPLEAVAGEDRAASLEDQAEIEERGRELSQTKQHVIVFGTSFVCLSLEVAWTRLFALVMGASTYSFASILASTLIGLSLGAALASFCKPRGGSRIDNVLAIAAASALIFIGLTLQTIDHLPALLLQVREHFNNGLPATYLMTRGLLAAALTLPQWIVLGTVLPIVLGEAARGPRAGAAAGKILLTSTFGSVAGAAITGFAIIPYGPETVGAISSTFSNTSGIQNAIICSALIQVALALMCLKQMTVEGKKLQRPSQGSIAVAMLCLVGFSITLNHPRWNSSAMSAGVAFIANSYLERYSSEKLLHAASKPVLFYREGQNSTVTVEADENANLLTLKNDGKVEGAAPWNTSIASTPANQTTEIMLADLPHSLVRANDLHALVIGLGTGTTCGAMTKFDNLKELSIAELEPGVYEAETSFKKANGDPLRKSWIDSGRVLPITADGRNILSLTQPQTFDLIVSQPAEPWVNGSSDLYSLEFWNLAKSRLKPDGIFCQWIQLFAIQENELAILLRTFSDAFPHVALIHTERAGEIILLGANNALPLGKNFLAQSKASGKTKIDLLADESKVKRFCEGQAARRHDARLNLDDNVIVEYALPPYSMRPDETIDSNLRALEQ